VAAPRPSQKPSQNPTGGQVPTRSQGPTALRIALGTQLRRLREANGISAEAASYAIRASHAKISRMELGRVGFKERDVADLLTLYGITDEHERATFLALARQANLPGWWHQYSDILPSWFEMYLGLEQASSVIRTYEPQLVPGLLQTEDGARSVIQLGNPDLCEADIDRRVALRMKRQRVLTEPDGPNLWGVVGRKAGVTPHFRYAAAMMHSGGIWTPDKLRPYIHEPQKTIPDVRMSFPGLKNMKDVDDIIAYLQTFK